MIEIRELVIKAIVEDSPRNNGGRNRREEGPDRGEQKGCAESIDMMLQIINDKKER